MKKFLLTLLTTAVILTAAFFLTASYRANLAKTYLNIGDQLSEKGEYSKAVLEYRKAHLISWRNAEICSKIAQSYQNLAKYHSAYPYYNKAIKLAPKNKNYYLSSAKLYWDQDDANEAIFVLRKGLDKVSDQSDRADLNILLGQIYLVKGDQNKAKSTFEQTNANFWLGIYYGYLADYQSAKKYFSQSSDENENQQAKTFLAAIEKILTVANPATKKVIFSQTLNQNDLAKLAEPILREVCSNYPDYRDAWIFLGYSQIELKKYDSAIESLNSAADLDPIYPLTFDLLSRVWAAKGDSAKANEYSKKAEELK